MAISKIILNGVTQMDLTSDTVDADNLLMGETAHGANGDAVVGTYEGGGGDPYNLKIAEGLSFYPGGPDWNSSFLQAFTNAGVHNRRAVLCTSGETQVYSYINNLTASCPLHLIPIPSGATTVSFKADKSGQYALREYIGSGASLTGSVATTGWVDFSANTPSPVILTGGTNYLAFGLRVSSSSPNFTASTEFQSFEVSFS